MEFKPTPHCCTLTLIIYCTYSPYDLYFWPSQPQTMSLLGYPNRVIPYTKFEHFGIIRFWVMLQLLVRLQMHLLTLWPWLFNPETISLIGYPKVIPYTKFENFGIIHFWVMLWTSRQTNKRTRLENPTHADRRSDGQIPNQIPYAKSQIFWQ